MTGEKGHVVLSVTRKPYPYSVAVWTNGRLVYNNCFSWYWTARFIVRLWRKRINRQQDWLVPEKSGEECG